MSRLWVLVVGAFASTAMAQEIELIGRDSNPFDRFGAAVAVSGDTAIVGAPGYDHQGREDCGAVFVFRRTAGSWSPVTRFVPYGAPAGLRFGSSVAMWNAA